MSRERWAKALVMGLAVTLALGPAPALAEQIFRSAGFGVRVPEADGPEDVGLCNAFPLPAGYTFSGFNYASADAFRVWVCGFGRSECPAGWDVTGPFQNRCIPSTTVPSPEKACGIGQCRTIAPAVGGPIVPGNANKLLLERDYAGAGPAPLRFERTYNSAAALAATGPLGSSWRHTYDRRIFGPSTQSGLTPPPPGDPYPPNLVRRPDGRMLYFFWL